MGLTNTVLYADDLAPVDWKVLTNIVVTHSPYVVVDENAPPAPKRFYEVAVTTGVVEPSGPINNMVWIPPGTFTMGSPTNEMDRKSNEGPQTQATISHGFWMGKYEVTQGEYEGLTGSNPSRITGNPTRPVETVSWDDATNYCGKLTAQEQSTGRLPAGFVYRLPTEAEWEYACRAGTTTPFSFGDDPNYTLLGNYGWYYGNSAGTTSPVGQKLANPWGLYDMHGNVWEWCWDRHSDLLPGGSVTDPKGPNSGSYRVYRGGARINLGRSCRSAVRDGYWPYWRVEFNGFRVVLAPELP